MAAFWKTIGLFCLLGLASCAPEVQIEILDAVPADECVAAEAGDFVSVHYRGQILDGMPFDNSYDRGQPIAFKLGSGQVIEGWDQGILGMCIGEKRKLTIPHELGYGEQGIGPIPPKATLIFYTELVDIGGKTKEKKIVRDEL